MGGCLDIQGSDRWAIYYTCHGGNNNNQLFEAGVIFDCPRLNYDTSNPGRCGPLFGGVRCNKALTSNAVYCNQDNGWCGDTNEHQNAQSRDIYDYQPNSCLVSSLVLFLLHVKPMFLSIRNYSYFDKFTWNRW